MRKRKMWVGYLFILPSFVGVLIFVLIPYIDVVRRAFMQTASGQFVGLLNFKAILQNKAFLLAFTNAGRFVGVCIPILLVLSLGIAVSLAKQTAYAEILKTGFVEKQLSALKELQSAEGKVVSPMDGVVSAVNIQVGGMTSGTADILIADTSAEMMLKVQFSEENKEHVIVGANVKLISDVFMETEKNAVGKLKITAIQQNTETGAGVEASIRIPPNTLPIGTSVGVQIETSKKMYSGCIPLEALHQEEGNQYYVYTTDEKKTILGTEVIARRVDVTVEYKGDRYAAVKGLSVDQNILLSSSKQISDGGRIKPQKQ